MKKTAKLVNLIKEIKHPAAANDQDQTKQVSDQLLANMDVFGDPRLIADRRKKNSIFFSTFKDRRSVNRRNSCSLNACWWMRRNYVEHSKKC